MCPICSTKQRELSALLIRKEKLAVEPGKTVLCTCCGAISVLTDAMQLRLMTKRAVTALPKDELALLAKVRALYMGKAAKIYAAVERQGAWL